MHDNSGLAETIAHVVAPKSCWNHGNAGVVTCKYVHIRKMTVVLVLLTWKFVLQGLSVSSGKAVIDELGQAADFIINC